MKTRIVLYGENDKPASILGDNPQEKVKKAWDTVIALLATTTDDILRVESVEVWDDKADTPQTDCLTCRYNSDEWDSPKCDSCSKAHSNYEPQTDCGWK